MKNAILAFIFLLMISVNCTTVVLNLSSQYPEYSKSIFLLEKIQYFEILASSSLQTLEYIIIEFTIDQESTKQSLNSNQIFPYACYEYDQYPSETSKSKDIFCKGYQAYQQKRANGKYSLIIPATPSLYKNKIVASFNTELSNIQQSFSVKIRGKFSSSLFDICPFNCNMGQSTPENCLKGICICPDGKIDDDCSLSALLISTSSQTLLLNKNSVTYAYFKPSKKIVKQSDVPKINIQFSLKSETPQATLYFNLGNQTSNKIVPSEFKNQVSYTLSKGTFSLSLDSWFQYDSNSNQLFSIFELTVFGDQTNSVDISIHESSSNNQNIMIICILAGLISIIFIILIISKIIKIKKAKMNRENRENLVILQQNILQQIQQNKKTDSKRKLTLEIIDKYMPSIPFFELDKKEKQRGKLLTEPCPVCLSEFQNSEICRQTICFHYFHKDCLEQWLKKQENCPFCRADLSEESLAKEKVYLDQILIEQPNQIKSLQLGSSNNLQQFQMPQQDSNLLAVQSAIILNANQIPSHQNILKVEGLFQTQRNDLRINEGDNELQNYQ